MRSTPQGPLIRLRSSTARPRALLAIDEHMVCTVPEERGHYVQTLGNDLDQFVLLHD